jgi:hypothetical protein
MQIFRNLSSGESLQAHVPMSLSLYCVHLPEVVCIAERALEHVVNPAGEVGHARVHTRHVFLPTPNAPCHNARLYEGTYILSELAKFSLPCTLHTIDTYK